MIRKNVLKVAFNTVPTRSIFKAKRCCSRLFLILSFSDIIFALQYFRRFSYIMGTRITLLIFTDKQSIDYMKVRDSFIPLRSVHTVRLMYGRVLSR